MTRHVTTTFRCDRRGCYTQVVVGASAELFPVGWDRYLFESDPILLKRRATLCPFCVEDFRAWVFDGVRPGTKLPEEEA